MDLHEISRDPLTLEKIVIQLMFNNKEVREKLLPYIDHSFFNAVEAVFIVKNYIKFVTEFDKIPSAHDFRLALKKAEHLEYFKQCFSINVDEFNNDFLMNVIEQFIKESLLSNEIADLYDRMDSTDFNISEESELSSKIEEILSFNFDDHVGLSLATLEGAESMYDFLHSNEYVIPTNIKALDDIIDGGYHTKALSLYMAGSGVGKSAIMCSQACDNLRDNKNVLYITLEMSEQRIGQRILSNFLDVNMDDLKSIPKKQFLKSYNDLIVKNNGLFIKEFPPSSINANHIKALLKELWNKKQFKPDIIYVDYLSLMRSTRKISADNPYREQKVISEEVRAIGVVEDIPIVSAVQTNREGTAKTIISTADIAESFGIVMGADLVIGAIADPELRNSFKANLIAVKNRYGENFMYTQVGLLFEKMRMSDIGDITHRVGDVSGDAPVQEAVVQDASESVSFVKDFKTQNDKQKTERLTGLDFS